MEKILSIVIPVFNVEGYIQKCLDSLLVPEDVLPLLDIVIVNDGTPDRSAEIAKTYERRYPGIFRVIDKENGGVVQRVIEESQRRKESTSLFLTRMTGMTPRSLPDWFRF